MKCYIGRPDLTLILAFIFMFFLYSNNFEVQQRDGQNDFG